MTNNFVGDYNARSGNKRSHKKQSLLTDEVQEKQLFSSYYRFTFSLHHRLDLFCYSLICELLFSFVSQCSCSLRWEEREIRKIEKS